MLRSIMADDLGMSFDEFYNYVNYDIALGDEKNPPIFWSLETYLFESASFRGERLCEISELQYYDLGSIAFSTYAFVEGISWIFLDGSGYGNEFDLQRKKAFTQKDAQVGLFFREIFIPLYLQEETDFEKTVLAYRYFLSVYDYLGFKFEGRAKNLKLVMDRVLEEYGQEKGKILLTYYCTYLRYIEGRNDENAKVYAENWNRHFKKCFGDKGALVYRNMLQKYRAHWRFIHETEYVSSRKLQYIDDRLVL
jgi:hypothetical protein